MDVSIVPYETSTLRDAAAVRKQLSSKKYLDHLTGFRAIAAYFVLITHVTDHTFRYNGIVYFHTDVLASLGMTIFFVLSGFVITYTYYDRFIQLAWHRATRDFAVARFARLYPLYILFLLGDIHQRSGLIRHANLTEWVSYLTLTQSWWNIQGISFRNAWSMSSECFFYICFAFWMIFDRTTSKTTVGRHTIAFVLGTIFILTAIYVKKSDIMTLLLPLRTVNTPDVWDWFLYIAPYLRIRDFIIGVCAARMFMVTQHEEPSPAHQQRSNLLCMGSCVAIVILMIIIYNWFAPDNFLYFLGDTFGYALFFAYIFYACSRYPNILSRWCSTRWMLIGGEISYSVYVLQILVLDHVLSDPVAQSPTPLAYEVSSLKTILYIILTTIVAYCSYHVIEVPSRRFLRKWLR